MLLCLFILILMGDFNIIVWLCIYKKSVFMNLEINNVFFYYFEISIFGLYE